MNDIFSNLKLLVSNQIQYSAFKTTLVQYLNLVTGWSYTDITIDFHRVWLESTVNVDNLTLVDQYHIKTIDKYGYIETMITVCETNKPIYLWDNIVYLNEWFPDTLNKAVRTLKVDLLLH